MKYRNAFTVVKQYTISVVMWIEFGILLLVLEC